MLKIIGVIGTATNETSSAQGTPKRIIQLPDMGSSKPRISFPCARDFRFAVNYPVGYFHFSLLHIVNMIRKSGTLLKVLGLVATYRTRNGNYPEVTVITVRWRYSVERLMTIKSPVGKGYLGNYLGTGTRETNRSAKDTVKGIPNFLKPQFNGALMRPILGSRT